MDVHGMTAAYALDALDTEERKRYEEHLAQCDECQSELAAFSETATALAYGVDTPPPPPALRGRILQAVAEDNVVALPLRRSRAFQAVGALAAVAACTAVALALWGTSLSRSLDEERSAQRAALRIVADPAAERIALRGAAGTLVRSPSGQSVLVLRGLHAAPRGKTYEAWVIPAGGRPIRAGVFDGGKDVTLVSLERRVPAGAVVAATVEPAGGVDVATTKPVFASSDA